MEKHRRQWDVHIQCEQIDSVDFRVTFLKSMLKKRTFSFWQIWNLSFGFLGVQFGFAFQNANASRRLTTLGADLHSLSLFWLVAPVVGLLVQPVVGAVHPLSFSVQ